MVWVIVTRNQRNEVAEYYLTWNPFSSKVACAEGNAWHSSKLIKGKEMA